MSLENEQAPDTSAPAPAAGEVPFQPGPVVTIAAGHASHDTYVGFLPVLLPHFVERFALSNTLAGWLSVFTQLPSILQPVFGHLADRLGAALGGHPGPGGHPPP